MSTVLDIAQKFLRFVKPSGNNNVGGPCPFHKGGREAHPSFYINVETGLFYCHSCHAKGTLIQFLKAMKAPSTQIDQIMGSVELRPAKDPFKRHDPGLGEHLLNESLLGVFQYCPTDLVKAGFDKKLLAQLEVGFDRKEMRITFPIRDLYGRLVGISGRAVLDDDNPRYKVYKAEDLVPYAPDDPVVKARYAAYEIKSHNFLWNMHNVYPQIFEGDLNHLIIAEGYKACIWLIQQGWPNTVALQGSRMSRAQELTLGRLGARFYLFLDHDQAGLEGTLDTGCRLVERGHQVKVCVYPDHYEDEKVQPDNLSREVIQRVIDAAPDFRVWRRDNGLQRRTKSSVRSADSWGRRPAC